jgi:hypothetical protein
MPCLMRCGPDELSIAMHEDDAATAVATALEGGVPLILMVTTYEFPKTAWVKPAAVTTITGLALRGDD